MSDVLLTKVAIHTKRDNDFELYDDDAPGHSWKF